MSFQDIILNVNGCERYMKVILPNKPREDNRYRLAIVLHGATGSASHLCNPLLSNGDINFVYKFGELLCSKGYILCIPSARSDFGNPGFKPRWESENSNNNDIDYINYITDTVVGEYNKANEIKIDTDSIYLIGGSSGGSMASRMALVNPTKYKGIVIVNALNADQIGIMDDGINSKLLFDSSKIKIPKNHPRTLLIASTIDSILPLQERINFYNKLYESSIDVSYKLHPHGNHGWGDWMLDFHDHMVDWMESK
jgi:poly(3-hydroxybutyrate) depolymerase